VSRACQEGDGVKPSVMQRDSAVGEYLGRGDITGLLAYHRGRHGAARMDDTTPPDEAATPPPSSGRAGGDDALKVDAARERDRRQAAETAREAADKKATELQAELDRIRNTTADEQAREREAQARRDGETTGRQAAVDEADQRLAPVLARLVATEARTAAVAAGVQPGEAVDGQPDRVSRFLALVDLTGLVNDAGEIDSAALTQRVSEKAGQYPELVAAPSRRAGNPGGPQDGSGPPHTKLSDRVSAVVAQMREELNIPAPTSTA